MVRVPSESVHDTPVPHDPLCAWTVPVVMAMKRAVRNKFFIFILLSIPTLPIKMFVINCCFTMILGIKKAWEFLPVTRPATLGLRIAHSVRTSNARSPRWYVPYPYPHPFIQKRTRDTGYINIPSGHLPLLSWRAECEVAKFRIAANKALSKRHSLYPSATAFVRLQRENIAKIHIF